MPIDSAPSFGSELREVIRHLSDWWENLRHGPVPGAYVPVQIGPVEIVGAAPLLNISFAPEVPAQAEIVAITTYITPGTTGTLRINNPPSATVFFQQPLAGGGQTWFRESFLTPTSHFLVPNEYFSIDLLTPVTGVPLHLGATLWLKNLSKIDPA